MVTRMILHASPSTDPCPKPTAPPSIVVRATVVHGQTSDGNVAVRIRRTDFQVRPFRRGEEMNPVASVDWSKGILEPMPHDGGAVGLGVNTNGPLRGDQP